MIHDNYFTIVIGCAIIYDIMVNLHRRENMKRYGNLHGNSGIAAYEVGANFIRIQFTSGSIYLYTYQSAGKDDVEEMKVLAKEGSGLTRFINDFRPDYASRER